MVHLLTTYKNVVAVVAMVRCRKKSNKMALLMVNKRSKFKCSDTSSKRLEKCDSPVSACNAVTNEDSELSISIVQLFFKVTLSCH